MISDVTKKGLDKKTCPYTNFSGCFNFFKIDGGG